MTQINLKTELYDVKLEITIIIFYSNRLVQRLKAPRDIVKDMSRFRRPSTTSTEVHVKNVKRIMLENRHDSVRYVEDEFDISRESLGLILVHILVSNLRYKAGFSKAGFFAHAGACEFHPTFIELLVSLRL